jgi:hypothetical protein
MKALRNDKIFATPVARAEDFCVAESRYYVLSCQIGGYKKKLQDRNSIASNYTQQ